MSLDDAVALAGQVLADYDTSGRTEAPGPDLLWRDQLARALRELTVAASAWHVTPVAVLAAAGEPAVGAGRVQDAAAGKPGDSPGRVRTALARIAWPWAARVSEPGAVVLSAADADVVWQALADAGAWHGVYGDCAACIAAGLCAQTERHEVIAVQYAALRAQLGGDRW